jgi:hypothetical protein
MLKRTNPPYTATEYRVAPATVEGGRNMDPEIKIRKKLRLTFFFKKQIPCNWNCNLVYCANSTCTV